MVITNIKRKGKSEIYKVFVDDNYFSLLEGEVILKHHIKIGGEFEKEELSIIKQESDMLVCSSMALEYVSKSLKTEFQVKQYLKKYNFCDEAIQKAIKKLKTYGYLNDEYYAKFSSSTMAQSKGKRYIKKELLLRGIKEEKINIALEDIGDESETCTQVAKKWLRGKTLPLDQKGKEKIYRFLISRGFEYETIKSVLNKIDNCLGEDDDWY